MSLILRKKGYDQWACIAPKGKDNLLHISWGAIEKATAYPDTQSLKEGFIQGIKDMHTAAQKKADTINAKGGTPQDLERNNSYFHTQIQKHTPFELDRDYGASAPLSIEQMTQRIIERATRYHSLHHTPTFTYFTAPDLGLTDAHTARAYTHHREKIKSVSLKDLQAGRVTHPQVVAELFSYYGFVKRASQAHEHLPQWVQSIEHKGVDAFFKSDLLIESQAQSNSFLQTQHTYFVRSRFGWLGLKKGTYTFLPQMQQATMFFDEQAARAAVTSASVSYQKVPFSDCALIKNQLVISQVVGMDPAKNNWQSDTEAAELASGCEALSIEQAIETAVLERQKAHEKAKAHTNTAAPEIRAEVEPKTTSPAARKRL